MSDYERLTERDWHEAKFDCIDQNKKRAILKRLWEIENQIENGMLIELPCKVGDTVWELDLFSKAKIREIKARNLLQILHWIDDESFGKFLFLTKAEAEAKLQEIKEVNKI